MKRVFNLGENLAYCQEVVNSVSDLLLYSHIFPIVVSIVFTIFIFMNSKNMLLKKIFLGISISFILWTLSNLSLWFFYDNNSIIMLVWSHIETFAVLLLLYLLYFVYVLVFQVDVKPSVKLIWVLLILPIIFFSFTPYNLIGIDLGDCVAFENILYINYVFLVKAVFLVWLMSVLLYGIIKRPNQRKALIITGLGVITFFISFFVTGYIATLTGDFRYEFYGLFGMILFIVLLSFSIERYSIIKLKVVSTELLVVAIILLIGSQFLYEQSKTSTILNSVTFIFVLLTGFLLVRSVNQVEEQKEKLKSANKQLQEANQNQESLLHFITHQVKGFMTVSRNIFDGLKSGDYGPVDEKVQKVAEHGFASETKAVQTIHSILQASDLKSGRTQFKNDSVNLSAIVQKATDAAQEMAQEKGLAFSATITPDIMYMGDEVALHEVFKNLVDNAVIYTEKGSVEVSLTQDAQQISFSVKDTGFGLTPEDKEKLFTAGGKSDDALEVNTYSTGYGLFIASEIIKRHHGEIGANSEGRRKGSEFYIKLPRK